jgi:hypothetical protein
MNPNANSNPNTWMPEVVFLLAWISSLVWHLSFVIAVCFALGS